MLRKHIVSVSNSNLKFCSRLLLIFATFRCSKMLQRVKVAWNQLIATSKRLERSFWLTKLLRHILDFLWDDIFEVTQRISANIMVFIKYIRYEKGTCRRVLKVESLKTWFLIECIYNFLFFPLQLHANVEWWRRAKLIAWLKRQK